MIVAGDEQSLKLAARVVAEGGVLAFRTDTFYGLGADPFNRRALRRVNDLKGREGGKPLLVVISDAEVVERLIAVREKSFALFAARHWPGPLTLVGRARAEVPEELTAGSGTIGVRLPDDAEVRSFVRATGGALTATSANAAGEPPARTAQEVAGYFQTALDLIIDGGEATGGLPSTVLDLSGQIPRLIREGAIGKEQLRRTLRELDEGLEL